MPCHRWLSFVFGRSAVQVLAPKLEILLSASLLRCISSFGVFVLLLKIVSPFLVYAENLDTNGDVVLLGSVTGSVFTNRLSDVSCRDGMHAVFLFLEIYLEESSFVLQVAKSSYTNYGEPKLIFLALAFVIYICSY
jgi:hypothetical protein